LCKAANGGINAGAVHYEMSYSTGVTTAIIQQAVIKANTYICIMTSLR